MAQGFLSHYLLLVYHADLHTSMYLLFADKTHVLL